MPVKLRHPKVRAHRITPELIAAWLALDHSALVQTLWLRPWWRTPIPYEVSSLGVSEWTGPDNEEDEEDWQRAIEIQRALVREAGWPDCRAAFKKNLDDDEAMRRFYQNRRIDLEEHHRTGKHLSPWPHRTELEETKQTIARYRKVIAWRRELLRLEEEGPGQGLWANGMRARPEQQ
jgi:hypothetical protein